MLYAKTLRVPAHRAESTPAVADLNLTDGVITSIEVEFQFGCNGLVSAYVLQGLHQIWPTNPDGRARGNGAVVRSSEHLDLHGLPDTVTLCGYSPDCAYLHDIGFRIEITPREIAERGAKLDTWIDRIGRILGLR